MTASSQSLAPKMNIAVLSALTDYILHPIPHTPPYQDGFNPRGNCYKQTVDYDKCAKTYSKLLSL